MNDMQNVSETTKADRLSDQLTRVEANRRRSDVAAIVRAWWVTSRMEYLPDALVHVALPLLLVLRNERWSARLFSLSLVGLAIWLLGHWVGSSLNCLADYPVDRLDTGHKSRLATAIDEAGARPILIVNLFEASIATGASIWLGLRLNKPLLILFWLGGFLIAYLYSFEPVRLKRRNLLNPLALMTIVYATPLLFVYHLLAPSWDRYDLTVLSIYLLQMIPMFLVDEVSDYDEDKEMKVNNPCVTYGRAAACWMAGTLYALSCSLSLFMFVRKNQSHSGWIWGTAVLAGLIYVWVATEFLTLLRLSIGLDKTTRPAVRTELTQELKRFSKTPAWLVATSLGVMLLAAALLSWN
jgi:1,4-dihydroxy-2-naphthoate octaprenyltransferase